MKQGMRHGWGMEIPIKNKEFRDKVRERQYFENKLILPDSDTEEY